MAKDKLVEYDSVANNNTVVGDVNLAENSMNPSDVNNALREIMSHQKEAFGSGTPLYVDQTNNRVGVNKTPTVALDVSGDADISGTLDATGIVTANAGVKVDNITIDGTEIDLSSGDLTVDVAGDIILDAAGADVFFGAGGNVGSINMAANEFIISSLISDKDMIFKGNDGGSTITALTFDMSEAGAATFNSSISVANTIAIASSNTSAFIQCSDNVFQLGTSSTDPFSFLTDNSVRMTIDSSGNLLVGSTNSSSDEVGARLKAGGRGDFTVSGGSCSIMNRKASDGTILFLQQENSTEGSISVSGTTVSYNGGHLSRWSQLADNTRDNTLVKGTVMTNLDQMAEWRTDGVTEDNEQLNCMAISSVEGDVNVAGVFVNWDNDDEVYKNDMNIAMTGDMVIRIAKDTTISRGDLLMSAGDGTAKTQDDDIVRSKTIAKVTSTNKSHTYDDGTYLVPCVLMAC